MIEKVNRTIFNLKIIFSRVRMNVLSSKTLSDVWLCCLRKLISINADIKYGCNLV